MTTYADMRLADALDAFASTDPLPGGGSAAAVTASLGVSLLVMVAGMSRTRTRSDDDAAALRAAADRLRPVRLELIGLIDEDCDAYRAVIRAYRQPRATDADRAARDAAIQEAIRRATEVPLQTMRLCERALRESQTIVTLGNPNAATDAAVGTRLLLAAVESAGLNVDVNAPGVTDAEYVRRATGERRALEARARELASSLSG